ncbi:MAG: NifB/NifX family molybdenum-iron cluster-binding protein, partial [Desulfobacterales bacterium]|nr:NifB/NifX family molybdenum-iron cluster-binding protein [Desulfobacterales bacterium]
RALQAQQQGIQPVAMLNFGKVAVASLGPSHNDLVSPQFARSPYFIIYDPAQKTASSIANPNANDLTSQSVQTAQYMVDLGVNNVISGSFDNESVNALHSLRINMYSGVTGTVQASINAYQNGQLMAVNVMPTPLTSPIPRGYTYPPPQYNVPNWGMNAPQPNALY